MNAEKESECLLIQSAGGDPDRPLAPLPERLSAEAALAEAILDLADVACKSADELRQLIAAHGCQARALGPNWSRILPHD